ncbi:MAG: hypothetical protein ACREDU_01635 [Methylocella sp.]
MKPLPVLAAFSHAVRSTTNNIGFAFHVSWPWILALLPLNIAGNIYILTNGITSAGSPSEENPKVVAVTFLMAIASMIAFASIAVNWHRYILLDEIPRGMQRLRLDVTVWRYVGNIILIFLIMFACALPAGFTIAIAAIMMGESSLYIIVPAYAALVFAAISAAYRLSIKLPAVALERRDYGFRDAWTGTQGNFWRFLGLALLYLAVAMVVGLLALLWAGGLGALGGTAGLAIGIAVQLVVNWALTILGVTMLTSLYGFFVEGRDF